MGFVQSLHILEYLGIVGIVVFQREVYINPLTRFNLLQ